MALIRKQSALTGYLLPFLTVVGLAAGPGLSESARPTSAALGTVTVTSEPDGASVYVDGRPAGTTPVDITRPNGAHRIRVVKQGYLENSRVLTVSAGETTRLSIKLTRLSEMPDQSASQGSTSGRWTSNKWIWLGAAGGAAAVAAVVLTKNDPPDAGTILVTPNATGMAGQTSFTLRAAGARDPDEDSLTFTWNFGDGGSGSGESVTHTFASVGTFQVQLAVSDGKHTVNAPNASVTVGPNLTGTWTGGSILMPDPTGTITVNCGLTLALTQNGSTVTGTMSFAGGCTGGPGSLASGSANPLTHPSAVAVASGPFPFPGGPLSQGLVILFAGTTSGTGTTMSGNVTLSNPSVGFVRTTATSFTKQ